jgi:hypothetical protein
MLRRARPDPTAHPAALRADAIRLTQTLLCVQNETLGGVVRRPAPLPAATVFPPAVPVLFGSNDKMLRSKPLNYDGSAIRQQLMTLQAALHAAGQQTELDPFDEAMFNAVDFMLELSKSHSVAVDALQKSIRKLERQSR